MILDFSKKFVCLEYSNPIENAVISIISKSIFDKKQQSIINCGAKNNSEFASGVSVSYSVFLLTVKGGFDSIQTDQHGKVTDTRLQDIYLNMTTEDFLNLITSYCFLKETTDFIEIYDVCIFLEQRGKGVGNILIQNAVKLYTKNYWLFVVPDNIQAAKLYIRNGFEVQNITQNDSSGVQIFSDTSVISMILNKQSSHTDIDYNIQLFNQMSDKILGFVKTETLNIKIDSEVINFIDTIVKNKSISYEVGGCLLTKHTDKFNLRIETKNGESFIVLGMHKTLIKGNSNTVGSTTSEYNFMFITQPISPLNYNGLVVQFPVYDITFCVQHMLYNISRLIKLQKFFIFSSDGVISISISSFLTQFILTCLDQSLEKGVVVRDEIFRHLQLCFNNLTTIKMAGIYQESVSINQQLVLQGGLQTSLKKQTGDSTCSFINRISIIDFAHADPVGVISNMLSIFFDQKGYLPVFSAKYHEISESASSEGLYISCEDTVGPRNNVDLIYSDENMVNSESFSREKVLSQLAGLPEFSHFVLE